MPSGDFKSELLKYSKTVGPFRRRRLEAIAENPKRLAALEKKVTADAKGKYGDNFGAIPWATILKVFLPLLLKFLEDLETK